MPADISRDSFDPRKGYTSVLLQQGRILTDADWNEQAAIMQHALRMLSRDLSGAHAVPPHAAPDSFRVDEVSLSDGRIQGRLHAGRYWVDGVALENPATLAFSLDDPGTTIVLVLLQGTQREVHPWQDPALHDPALPTGASQLRTRWEWRLGAIPYADAANPGDLPPCPQRGRMRVRLRSPGDPSTTLPPVANGYLGTGNMLYRVQILRDGVGSIVPPVFAWSRNNASQSQQVLDRLAQPDGHLRVEVEDAHDHAESIRVDDWVRYLHASGDAEALPLLQVMSRDGKHLLLRPANGASASDYLIDGPAVLQRWHHLGSASEGGGIAIARDRWFALENGIEVAFDDDLPLRADDYWLIPARASAGLVGWTEDTPQPAHGPERVQAALVRLARDSATASTPSCTDLRWQLRLERTPVRVE